MPTPTAPTSVPQRPSPAALWSQGLRRMLPLSLSIFGYGLVYGAMAHDAHLGFSEALSMSIFLAAGAAQFAILGLWHAAIGPITLALSTVLINARQVLYGLTLGPHLKHIRTRTLAWIAYGVTDESYSVTMVETLHGGPVSVPFLTGVLTGTMGPWWLSSAIGFVGGALVGNLARFGLDFAFLGAILGLLITQLKGGRHVVAAGAAGVAAVIADHWAGPSGAVFAGAGMAFLIGLGGAQ